MYLVLILNLIAFYSFTFQYTNHGRDKDYIFLVILQLLKIIMKWQLKKKCNEQEQVVIGKLRSLS